MRRGPEIALPEEAWAELGVAEGDELDIELVDDGVPPRPVATADRERAWEDLMGIITAPKWRARGPTGTHGPDAAGRTRVPPGRRQRA